MNTPPQPDPRRRPVCTLLAYGIPVGFAVFAYDYGWLTDGWLTGSEYQPLKAILFGAIGATAGAVGAIVFGVAALVRREKGSAAARFAIGVNALVLALVALLILGPG